MELGERVRQLPALFRQRLRVREADYRQRNTGVPDAIPYRRFFWGKLLSHALNPIAMNVPILSAVALLTGRVGPVETLVILFLSTGVPTVYTILMHEIGVFSNIFISNRRERIYFLPVVILVAVLCVWVVERFGYSDLFRVYFIVSTVNILLASVITIWYKVSLHLFGITSLAVFLGWYWGGLAWLSLLMIPACASGRLMLREHTPGQVALGTTLGLTLTPLLLLILG